MIVRRLFTCLFCLLLISMTISAQRQRVVIDFNKDWKFALQNDSTAANGNFPDQQWRVLDLPHDWSIEGEFRKDNPATTQGGALPGGIGWYRKSFVLPGAWDNKNIAIEFDGVYRNSEVWINGHYLGKRPNGYISFQYDLSPYLLKAPAKNVIAVKVDNSLQPNSRWYTGSGIYRNVRLVATNSLAVKQWGSFVQSKPVPGKDQYALNIETVIRNDYANPSPADLEYLLLDQNGRVLLRSNATRFLANKPEIVLKEELLLNKPVLWSIENPFLYKLLTRITRKGKLIDSYETTFGLRSFYFDADKGFFLNQKPVKIKGVCMHHDLGALGAAVNVRAIERQLEILKEMGCNAIRTAHNPSTPELLELCDKMGFLVMVEAFDMWKKKKNKYDYYADFEEWHVKDLQDMVLRDRNHPSVFMWSIGNEIREQFDSTGISITRELVSIVKALDTTRPVMAALSEWNPAKNYMYQSGALDIVGLNYHHEVYEDFKKHYPGQKFLGAENMSALATRGHYDWPSDSSYFWPARSPMKYVENGNPDYTVSAYDQVAAYWGSTHEQTWKIIRRHDYLSGLFVWTGFDYLGEPTPYPWPARSSYFGIVDLAGFPKDVYYMYQSEWTNKTVLHILPHWNFEGRAANKPVDIWVYYNNADEVELFLNDRSLGTKRKGKEDLHVMWRVPFSPGELKAVSRKNGQIVKEEKIYTAGKPAKIELQADRSVIKADGKDLSFVTVRILDKDGYPVPDAGNEVEFMVSGEGALLATDNGYQADTISFKSNRRRCWKGMALGIIQSTGKKGNITLKVSSPGLTSAELRLNTTDQAPKTRRIPGIYFTTK